MSLVSHNRIADCISLSRPPRFLVSNDRRAASLLSLDALILVLDLAVDRDRFAASLFGLTRVWRGDKAGTGRNVSVLPCTSNSREDRPAPLLQCQEHEPEPVLRASRSRSVTTKDRSLPTSQPSNAKKAHKVERVGHYVEREVHPPDGADVTDAQRVQARVAYGRDEELDELVRVERAKAEPDDNVAQAVIVRRYSSACRVRFGVGETRWTYTRKRPLTIWPIEPVMWSLSNSQCALRN